MPLCPEIDIRIESIGICFKQGSDNYGGVHRQTLEEPEYQLQLPGLKKGDVVIFDRNTLHRSLKNETSEDRFAYAAQYLSSHSRMAETGEKDLTRMPARSLSKILEPYIV